MTDGTEIVASGFRRAKVLSDWARSSVKRPLSKASHVTMLKSHGTEMRGGYVRSQVVLSQDLIDSPMCETPNYFIALSLAA